MADATCSIDGCERPVKSRGWCGGHYARWRSLGDPLPAKPLGVYTGCLPRTATPAERLMAKIERMPSGCWEWRAVIGALGYGRIRVDGRTAYSHRIAYESFVGPIPDGLQLDHLCRNRSCCNPEHLEPVTPLENIRRGAGNPAKTHCPQGHPYAGDNLQLYKGRRVCRACTRRRAQEWREARKSA